MTEYFAGDFSISATVNACSFDYKDLALTLLFKFVAAGYEPKYPDY